MLYNYPSADMRCQGGSDNIYPRAADEFACVKSTLGEVGLLMNLVTEKQDSTINDPMEEKPVEEEVDPENPEGPSQMDEGGEEAEEAPEEPQEEVQAKKPGEFNPEDFEWTVSDGKPKNLAQVYFKEAGCIQSVSGLTYQPHHA